MFGATTQVVNRFTRIAKATDKAAYRNFSHAAASIRKTAQASIVPSDEPSPPGKPPHTRLRLTKKGTRRKGQIERAIVYSADKHGAVIGPRASVVGTSVKAHEFGGKYKKQTYPKRPTMAPALEKNLERFAGEWAGSIGG